MGLGDLDEIEIDASGLFDDLVGALSAAAEVGAADAAAALGVELGRVPEGALRAARETAARLVGMVIGPDGEVTPNPNPVWSITEQTREQVRAKVVAAIEQGQSPQALTESLSSLFDYSRAEMIARTETGFAYNAGAGEVYVEGGQDYVEVVDGDGCLPGGHSDGAPFPIGEIGLVEMDKQANGQVWPVDMIAKYPLGHPNCVRAFIPYNPEV